MNISSKGHCTECGKLVPMVLKENVYFASADCYEIIAMWYRFYCKDCNHHTHPKHARIPDGMEIHDAAIFSTRVLLRTIDEYTDLLQQNGIGARY